MRFWTNVYGNFFHPYNKPNPIPDFGQLFQDHPVYNIIYMKDFASIDTNISTIGSYVCTLRPLKVECRQDFDLQLLACCTGKFPAAGGSC